ncbi:ParA family protein [Streptomyces sp. NPDC048110]|uniref:ParA family protein n=1 Tax=Streptomyces sp. NPDC048110 TaxID=3155483 RepID=UPI0033FC681C
MARVIAFVNQKGGVGKTTNTVNLAAIAGQALGSRAGESQILVVSTDPQASAVWWSDRVDEGQLPFDFHQCDDKPDDLARLKLLDQYEYVFVDTPGNIEDEKILSATLDSTDEVVVPLPPEAMAFNPAKRTIEKVLEPKGIPFRILITDWDPRDGTVDLEQTQAYVDSNGWPRLQSVVRHYKIHTRAAAEGQVCTQYPKGRIALEAREDFFRLAMELGIGGRPLPRQTRKRTPVEGKI